MKELTQRQKQVFDFIKKSVAKGGPFPSLREIALELGMQHKSGVTGHLRSLERKGYIKKSRERISDFSLSGEGFDGSQFHLVADVAAGQPRSCFDDEETKISFDHSYFGGGELVAVRIAGESMSGDGIHAGDIGIIRRQVEAGLRDIVAVRIDNDGVTLKRLRRIKSYIELIPSNPDFQTQRYVASDVEIVGKLVGVVRNMAIR